MNYFKPDKYYCIIPILRIDNWLMVNENNSLFNYVNDNFPILRELDNERIDVLCNKSCNSSLPISLNREYRELCRLIEYSLEKLALPNHILAVGDEVEAREVVTGRKIYSLTGDVHTLKIYRVSDCELEKYYIENYEDKVKRFFSPDELVLKEARKSKEDFLLTTNLSIKKIKRK